MGLGDIFRIKEFKAEIKRLQESLDVSQKQLNELSGLDYFKVKEMTSDLEKKYLAKEAEINDVASRINSLKTEESKLNKTLKTQTNKIARSKELVNAANYSLQRFLEYEPSQNACKISLSTLSAMEELSPSVLLKLHHMDVRDLKKAFRENDKQITKTLEKYSARYTTKANRAIYSLMVIALRAELQNILYDLKYEKLDVAIESIKTVCGKYLKIAGEGNQSIVGTLTKFIGEIEYLFINAAKIEYNYYVKKEQARQEQLAIREQMRQEAEERKALEAERKKVEQEEQKYNNEIQKLQEQLKVSNDDELQKLKDRILELQAQLSDVIIKKEEIANLANGKAGNVYVISNLGSFGENVFKVGMTRRINPQDRVNELGDASVPFKFDVHSFIFSDDAVSLEADLHNELNKKRVNKVNRRKEFFYTTLDELEELVLKYDPTAEFNKTMLAEEFRQSQSSEDVYDSEWHSNDSDEDSDE